MEYIKQFMAAQQMIIFLLASSLIALSRFGCSHSSCRFADGTGYFGRFEEQSK